MTTDTKRTSLKTLAFVATLVFAATGAVGQQATPAQGTSDASKKHLAGVKYQSMSAAKDATPNTTSNATPNATAASAGQAPADATKRKDGAIMAADFNKRQAGAPLKGVGATRPADAKTAADKGIGSAGIPGKAATTSAKAPGAPIKGLIHK